MPENPYPCELQLTVKVGKTPYVRFDLNDYTIPHTHVRRTLTVRASPRQVRILDGTELLATHERSYDRGAQIAAHINALVERKRREARQAPPPVGIHLPEHVRHKDKLVIPHRLDIYDQIAGDANEHA